MHSLMVPVKAWVTTWATPFDDAVQKTALLLFALQVTEGPASAPKYRVSPTPMPVRCEEWGGMSTTANRLLHICIELKKSG